MLGARPSSRLFLRPVRRVQAGGPASLRMLAGNRRTAVSGPLCVHAHQLHCFCCQFQLVNTSQNTCSVIWGFPGGLGDKESACNAGDLGSIPGLGRSPGEGKGYPLQYSGLENSMDCIVHGVAKSQTQLRDFLFHFLSSGMLTNLVSPGTFDKLAKQQRTSWQIIITFLQMDNGSSLQKKEKNNQSFFLNNSEL